MKKSYSALKAFSSFSIVFGYVLIVIGLLLGLFYFQYYGGNASNNEEDLHRALYVPFVPIVASFALALPFWAVGQFIKLCIDVADNISTMNENLYFYSREHAKESTINANVFRSKLLSDIIALNGLFYLMTYPGRL